MIGRVVIVFLIGLLCKIQVQGKIPSRPMWNIGHMVNSIKQADYFVDAGCNSLEFDINFDSNGAPKYTYHGIPCDCFRNCKYYEDFNTFIDYMRQMTTPGHPKYRERMILLFMDFKLGGVDNSRMFAAGQQTANRMLDHYWQRGKSGARAYVLLSMPSIWYSQFFEGFRKTLISEGFEHYLEKVGADFSDNENLDKTGGVYTRLGLENRIWQGDGITNCLPRGTGRLMEAIARRDRPGQKNYIDKVYWWTVDKKSTLRTVLRMGVDGMIVNYPEKLPEVIEEEEFKGRFHIATIDDNPWQRHSPVAAFLAEDAYIRSKGNNVTQEMLHPIKDQILYN